MSEMQRRALIAWTDAAFHRHRATSRPQESRAGSITPASVEGTDFKLDVERNELEALVGVETVERLTTLLGGHSMGVGGSGCGTRGFALLGHDNYRCR